MRAWGDEYDHHDDDKYDHDRGNVHLTGVGGEYAVHDANDRRCSRGGGSHRSIIPATTRTTTGDIAINAVVEVATILRYRLAVAGRTTMTTMAAVFVVFVIRRNLGPREEGGLTGNSTPSTVASSATACSSPPKPSLTSQVASAF